MRRYQIVDASSPVDRVVRLFAWDEEVGLVCVGRWTGPDAALEARQARDAMEAFELGHLHATGGDPPQGGLDPLPGDPPEAASYIAGYKAGAAELAARRVA